MNNAALISLIALTLAACGAGSGENNSNRGSAVDHANCGAETVERRSPEEIRDAYIAAMEALDDESMIELLTGPDREGTAGKWIRRGFKASRESSDSYTCEVLAWEDRGAYWTCSVSQQMNLKDGGTHTLPSSEFFVVTENDHWRVSWIEPGSD